MEPLIRPARPEDREAIAAFTQNTFSWGDYVARVLDDWLAEPEARVMVAELEGRAVAMSRVTLVSPDEAWAQGARVAPALQRRGLATRLGQELWRWAAQRGAKVVRLMVEDWNEPARAQVGRMGFRAVCAWLIAERGVGDASPVPEGNGGRRVGPAERLRLAASAEAEPALLSWASGPLHRAARGLFPVGWTWRRLKADDVLEAARRGSLWEGRPGWAIADVQDDTFRVSWVETSAEDAPGLTRALVDQAAGSGVERMEVMLPAVDWLRRALQDVRCDLHPLTVYAKTLA